MRAQGGPAFKPHAGLAGAYDLAWRLRLPSWHSFPEVGSVSAASHARVALFQCTPIKRDRTRVRADPADSGDGDPLCGELLELPPSLAPGLAPFGWCRASGESDGLQGLGGPDAEGGRARTEAAAEGGEEEEDAAMDEAAAGKAARGGEGEGRASGAASMRRRFCLPPFSSSPDCAAVSPACGSGVGKLVGFPSARARAS